MLIKTVAALLGIASLASAAKLVTDESTRMKVLAVLFPKARINEIQGKRIDNSGRVGSVEFPDALKDEKVYHVEAPPIGEAEECAASSLVDPEIVGRRRVLRLKLFSLGNEPEYVAAMQYKFSDANPPFACPSIARLSIVSQRKRVDDYVPEMTHHSGWQTIGFANLTGPGSDDLIVESDWGGGGAQYGELSIFDLAPNKLRQLIQIRSRGVDYQREWASVLDVAKTASKQGREFCFTQTTFQVAEKTLQPPQATYPCYPPGNANQ